MKMNGNAIRPGNVIDHKGDLWRAVKTQHVKPGKGGAFLQVELKRLKDGTKLNERFRASETVERAILEQRNHQFLFADGDTFTFMDVETYDQVELHGEDIGEGKAFLQDGMTVIVETHEGKPLGVSLPDHVTLEVVETEPAIKNQTATSSYKPALLENGVKTTVPQFVNPGDRIILATADSTYTKRAD